jgi:hypothetical protein
MKIWLLLLAVPAVFFSCKKSTKYLENKGVITGINVSACASIAACPNVCDGALFFHFTGVADTSQVAIDNPTIFKLPQDVKFPIPILVEYQITTRCGISAISVINYKML